MSANQGAPSVSVRAYAPFSDYEKLAPELYIDGPQLGFFVVAVG